MRNRCVSGSRGAFLLGLAVISAFIIAACGGSAASTAELSGRTGAGAGRGGQRPAVTVERTTAVEHITVQRQVDLSGHADVAGAWPRSAARSRGRCARCWCSWAPIVRPGDVLVRLDPRELQLAVDRAESALNQAMAQLGIPRGQDVEPPADEQIATVRQALGQPATTPAPRTAGPTNWAAAACCRKSTRTPPKPD